MKITLQIKSHLAKISEFKDFLSHISFTYIPIARAKNIEI